MTSCPDAPPGKAVRFVSPWSPTCVFSRVLSPLPRADTPNASFVIVASPICPALPPEGLAPARPDRVCGWQTALPCARSQPRCHALLHRSPNVAFFFFFQSNQACFLSYKVIGVFSPATPPNNTPHKNKTPTQHNGTPVEPTPHSALASTILPLFRDI